MSTPHLPGLLLKSELQGAAIPITALEGILQKHLGFCILQPQALSFRLEKATRITQGVQRLQIPPKP